MAAAVTTTSTTLEGQMFEIAREMQEAELAVPEENRPNRVGFNVDVDALQVTITVQLPITFSGTGGAVQLAAATYLP